MDKMNNARKILNKFKVVPEVVDDVVAKGASAASAVGKAVSMPQRAMLAAIAQKLGKRGDAENSEASSQDIVEAAAERLGIPEDSTVGNMAKALGVAGLETFADPTSLIPGGKLAGAALKLKNAKAVEGAIAKFAHRTENIDLTKGKALVDMLKAKKKSLAEQIAERDPSKVIKAPKIFGGK